MTPLTDIPKLQHAWDLPPREAKALQSRLSGRVIRKSRFGSVTTVAGVDCSYRGGEVCAAVVVLSYPGLELLDQAGKPLLHLEEVGMPWAWRCRASFFFFSYFRISFS